MRKSVTSLCLALLATLLFPTFAAAEAMTWEADPVHSGVEFSVRHFLTQVPGRFNDFSGTIVYDPENVAASSVEFTVDAASIDTANEQRDNHLRSPDFFDVEKHPNLHFKSKKVHDAGDGELHVTGDLTIHGVTKEVTVPAEFLGKMDTPMGPRAGFQSEFEIDRKDYGIVWNRALDQGGAVLGDDVKIEISIEAKPAAPAEADEAAGE